MSDQLTHSLQALVAWSVVLPRSHDSTTAGFTQLKYVVHDVWGSWETVDGGVEVGSDGVEGIDTVMLGDGAGSGSEVGLLASDEDVVKDTGGSASLRGIWAPY